MKGAAQPTSTASETRPGPLPGPLPAGQRPTFAERRLIAQRSHTTARAVDYLYAGRSARETTRARVELAAAELELPLPPRPAPEHGQ